MSKSIGDNIKSIRKSLGLTQTEVAEKLYTTPQNISRIESREGDPTAEMLIGLSEVFDVSVDTLVGKEYLPENELMAKIQNYFKSADNDVLSNRVFGICKNMIYGRYIRFFDNAGLAEKETYTNLCNRELICVFSDRTPGPRIFAAAETSAVNLTESSTEKIIEIFNALSDPAVFQLINKISAASKEKRVTYDKVSFCTEFGIDINNFDNVLSSLLSLELVTVKNVSLNGSAIDVYCPHINEKIILLVSLADLLYNNGTDGNIH